jgi:hypothetical protein
MPVTAVEDRILSQIIENFDLMPAAIGTDHEIFIYIDVGGSESVPRSAI